MKTTKQQEHHYVYKITNNNPTDSRKYYIGVRTAKGCTPEEDTKYWGSSKSLNISIKEQGILDFSKEILSTWETREEAASEELRLLRENDVINNLEFYNRAINQSKVDNRGFITVLDIRTKTTKAVSVEEYRQNDFYKHMSDGYVNVYDMNDKINKKILIEEYYLNDYYLSHTKNKVTVFDTITKKTMHLDKEDFDDDRYISINKGKVVVYDNYEKRFRSILKEDYIKQINRYTSQLSNLVCVKDEDDKVYMVSIDDYDKNIHTHINSKTEVVYDTQEKINKRIPIGYNKDGRYRSINSKRILIYDAMDNLMFESNDNFGKFCKLHHLPHDALSRSYRNNGEKIYTDKMWIKRLESNPKKRFIGWYAIKDEK